jgi:TldD protein
MAQTTSSTVAFGMRAPTASRGIRTAASRPAIDAATAARATTHARLADPASAQELAQRAVDAARQAGATYADARLTRSVRHGYDFQSQDRINGQFSSEEELLGIGVRALVNGYWGFAATPAWNADEIARVAADAVSQAKANALGPNRPVDLGKIPAVQGSWTMPIAVDPFTVPIEEKLDHIIAWKLAAMHAGLMYDSNNSSLSFVRQERVLATSEGTVVSQVLYETSGSMVLKGPMDDKGGFPKVTVRGIESSGVGWEMFTDDAIVGQFPQLLEEAIAQGAHPPGISPVHVGRYTVVCSGKMMAELLDKTLGLATQLDRALGYEANAGGTSYLRDPLGMLGQFQAASPVVTITANRSAPTQLATVKWDDEGVVPEDVTLIKDGIVNDFQTTREQAAWLAPYYAKVGRPVQSHGYAASENALAVTLQHMPNLSLRPSAAAVRLEDMIASVREGVLADGYAACDFQGRSGILFGLREIKNGRLGKFVNGGGISFDSLDFWKHVRLLGGASTLGTYRNSQWGITAWGDRKGQPPQRSGHTVQAVAATIENQPLIDVWKKA